MTEPIDIYRTATMLIKEHGNYRAQLFAVTRAEELKAVGDQEGQGVWIKVLDAIRDVSESEPDEDDAVH